MENVFEDKLYDAKAKLKHPQTYVNHSYAKSRGISDETIQALDIIYVELDKFLSRPSLYVEESLAPEIVRGFEYVLQKLWGFPLESKFHRYEFHLNGCSCPILDNYEMIGHTDSRYYSMNCPFHGKR